MSYHQGRGTLIYPTPPIFILGQSVKLLNILALTLDQEYNFALTFDKAATLDQFDSGIECINS